MWTMDRDGKRFSGVRWVVLVTCVPCLFRYRVVQLLISFSFVVATLYMVALLVSDPMETRWITGHFPLLPVRFDDVAGAWCKYASFVLIQKMPSPYDSMSPCICVSTVHMAPLAAKSSPTVLFV
jgi:hypothetical protein